MKIWRIVENPEQSTKKKPFLALIRVYTEYKVDTQTSLLSYMPAVNIRI